MTDYISGIGAKFITTPYIAVKELSPTDKNPAIFMNTNTGVLPYANNAWTQVDLSQHVPIGAKWVMLSGHVIITNPYNAGADFTIAFRALGETGDYAYTGQAYCAAGTGHRGCFTTIIPVVDRKIEIKTNWYVPGQSSWPTYQNNGPAWGLNLQVVAFGYGDCAVQPTPEPPPPVGVWNTLFNAAMTFNGSGMQNRTVITAIKPTVATISTKARVTLCGNLSQWGTAIYNNCWIGKKGAGLIDFDGTQQRVKFSNQNGATIPQGGSPVVSDEVLINFAPGDEILVAVDIGGNPAMGAGACSGVNAFTTAYHKASGTDAASTLKTGYAPVAGWAYAVGKVELWGAL